ncbi:MAG: two-component system, NtrC family, response regulator HydG [Acidobacteriota bacterium]|jgi:DNA-binding NtrC family response regulator|nr:two-component system, NtrC family, response regulator HydG [Acidobacteriota bacterium]
MIDPDHDLKGALAGTTGELRAREADKKLQALVIDDDQQIREFVSAVLRDDRWNVAEAETAERAYEMLDERRWSLVFCDVMLGGEDGFAVLRRFTEEQPDAQVVLMTGHGSAVGALDATAFGAYDYLLKPFGISEVLTLAGAVRERSISRRAHARRDKSEDPLPRGYISDIDLVGRSAAFVNLMKLVGRVAPTDLPMLITGESGTGKEVVARAIHRRSRRAARPFIAVNCGAIPAELIESELFGHVRGAFTGAERDRRGLWEEADGGTVFLDEITETTPTFQVKLLRALQEGEIRRVGSNQTQSIDVRVIAASNRNVETEVSDGRFRQDLLYRLNAVTINLPPLRERPEDIQPLVMRFAERVRPSDDTPIVFSRAALRLLEQYAWPGNIRELENAVVRAAALCDQTVRPEDLPERVRKNTAAAAANVEETSAAASSQPEQWLTLEEVEQRYVARVLVHTGGNKQAAARLLGVDRKTIERMIKRHNINPVKTTRATSQTG